MKKLAIYLFVVLGVLLVVRQAWFYPAYKRPPVLHVHNSEPVSATSQAIVASDASEVRYYRVNDDKALAYPESKSITWSPWAASHVIQFDDTPQWIKIFIEEKWWIFKKRSVQTFFNMGKANQAFDTLLKARFLKGSNRAKERKSIVFIGDSLTVGLYADQPQEGFTAVVEERIGKKGAPDRLGIIKIKAVEMGLPEISKRINAQTEVAVVELGTNDFGVTPLDVFRENYSRLLQAIASGNRKVKIVCLSTWDGYRGFQYDEVIKREAEIKNAKFVYLGDLFEKEINKSSRGANTPWGKADDFHPSSKGHLAIAERVINAIVAFEERH